MKKLEIYDPAMCCSTGVCGVEVDPVLVQFAADLSWVGEQGVSVTRYNLGQEPQAFAVNAAVVACRSSPLMARSSRPASTRRARNWRKNSG
jgi:hypothetical protein